MRRAHAIARTLLVCRSRLTNADACVSRCGTRPGLLITIHSVWPCHIRKGPGHPHAGGAVRFSCWRSEARWNFRINWEFRFVSDRLMGESSRLWKRWWKHVSDTERGEAAAGVCSVQQSRRGRGAKFARKRTHLQGMHGEVEPRGRIVHRSSENT